MKKEIILPNLLLFRFKTQYELSMTFLRIQEYYESPLKNIRNKYFNLEDYMDAHAKRFGNFDYTSRWKGFNVPGNIIRKFVNEYSGLLRTKEINLLNHLKPYLVNNNFYVLGVFDNSVIDHEIAHGLFYLNAKYRNKMIKLIRSLPINFRKRFVKALQEKGYASNVLIDEIHAYSICNAINEIVSPPTFKINKNERKYFDQFLKLFQEYKGVINEH